MTTAKVMREFFAIRYEHAEFGARPDLTHPHLVEHPMSAGRYVVIEHESMYDAYLAAHAAIASVLLHGPLKGVSMTGSRGVDVIRVVEHEPVTTVSDEGTIFEASRTVTMTITGVDHIPGIPHFATAPLSRYNPVNGWGAPDTVEVA